MARRLALTITLCFGLGLGLARAEPIAHASKCELPELGLRLDRIEGDGDSSLAEREFWSHHATVYENTYGATLVINVDGESEALSLERP